MHEASQLNHWTHWKNPVAPRVPWPSFRPTSLYAFTVWYLAMRKLTFTSSTTTNNPSSRILCTCKLVHKMIVYKEQWYTNTAVSWDKEGFLQQTGNINLSIPTSVTFCIMPWLHLTFRLLKVMYQGDRKWRLYHSLHKRMFLLILLY